MCFFKGILLCLIVAIYMEINKDITIMRSLFSNNIANFGAAIYISYSNPNSVLEIIDSIFISNTSSNYGGAIYMQMIANTCSFDALSNIVKLTLGLHFT